MFGDQGCGRGIEMTAQHLLFYNPLWDKKLNGIFKILHWQPYSYLLENYLMANKPDDARD